MPNRPIKIDFHNALVLAIAPLMMIVPYVLTFDPKLGLLSFFLGAAAMGIALSGIRPQTLPGSTIAGFDRILGLTTVLVGLVSGLTGQPVVTTIFLVGFGAAHLALTAATRYGSRGA
ncbi:MAG: hypothetical protein M9938_10155 [Solirubrobacterales bacterium]|nr:hypothetical protein [Solirubrobacterales bacterium]